MNPQVRRDYLAWTPAEKEQREDGAHVIPQHGIEEHQNMMNPTHTTVTHAVAASDPSSGPSMEKTDIEGHPRSRGS